MATTLLQTKLYSPSIRPGLVPRPHLIKKLNDGLDEQLTLISAPPGFGKTTLVIEWLRSLERPFTWLTLDEEDNDLSRFLTYFITALQKIKVDLGQAALSAISRSQSPPTGSLWTVLFNEIVEFDSHFVFVLDDYHAIHTLNIHEAINFLLQNLPPQMHLVVISRADPPLYLSRLRVQQKMTEIRENDLRFTSAE